jgi:hypothetical protein
MLTHQKKKITSPKKRSAAGRSATSKGLSEQERRKKLVDKACGMFADVSIDSEAFMSRKQEEIDLEDRRFSR